MAGTITTRVQAFRMRPSIGAMIGLFCAVLAQGRLIEAVHGAVSAVLRRPSAAENRELPPHVVRRAREVAAAREADVVGWFRSRHPLLDRWIPEVPIRPHGVTRCGEGVVAGEYRARGARLFLLSEDRKVVCDHYCRQRGVHHIHFVHGLDAERFLVSTGDSARRLDLWRVEGGRLRFERRVIARLAGYTAVATVAGETFVGSDFSGRPNFLLRLSDRRKFFLPRPEYLRYVWFIDAVDDRYLIVASKQLDAAGGARGVSIFDTAHECFVEPG